MARNKSKLKISSLSFIEAISVYKPKLKRGRKAANTLLKP